MDKLEILKDLESLGFIEEYDDNLVFNDVWVEVFDSAVTIENVKIDRMVLLRNPSRQNVKDLVAIFSNALNTEEYLANKWDMFLRQLYLHKSTLKGFDIIEINTYEYIIVSNGKMEITICCDMIKGSPYVLHSKQELPLSIDTINDIKR